MCFVAETDGKIIGTIMAGNDGRRGHIYHLTVKPKYR
jgi:ribosomal protein S18 acetylase RimI-like enzyme